MVVTPPALVTLKSPLRLLAEDRELEVRARDAEELADRQLELDGRARELERLVDLGAGRVDLDAQRAAERRRSGR